MDFAFIRAVAVLLATASATYYFFTGSSTDSNDARFSLLGGDVQEVVYRGAVLEMVPYVNPDLKPVENLLANVKIMAEYGSQAKDQGADIIVFPEYAMYTDAPKDRPGFLAYTQYVPDPKSREYPCGWDTAFNHDEVVRNLSCIAKNLEMYMVVNMPERVDCTSEEDPSCPEDNHYFHNLNVVFDRHGVLISKYRKLHLFKEPFMNVGNTPDEEAIFTTDFGVTFTQHICFDTLFYRPTMSNIEKYGIKDIVMPTSWVDHLPFMTAPQAQYSYSRALGANLLVAGRHRPHYAAAGSGIYTAAKDIAKSVNIYDDTQGTRLLVQDVRTVALRKNIKITHRGPKVPPQVLLHPEEKRSIAKVSPHHYFFSEDLTDGFESSLLSRNSDGSVQGTYVTPEHPDEYIRYNLQWTLEGEGDYYFVLKSGPAGPPGYQLYRQIGGIVYCAHDLESCGKVPVEKPTKATFHSLNLTLEFGTPYLFPSMIDQDFALVDDDKWEYTTRRIGDRYIASIVNKDPLDFVFAVAIASRIFEKDPFCDENIC